MSTSTAELAALEAIGAGIEEREAAAPPHPNRDLIDGMRQMADWLETHPEVERIYSSVQLDLFPEDLAVAVRGMGRLTKAGVGQWFVLEKIFNGMAKICWNKRRDEVCERIVTGTKTVTRPIMEQVGTETVEEPTFEWRCPDSILRPTQETSDAFADLPNNAEIQIS